MPSFHLRRIPTCSHNGCQALGVANDNLCMEHSRFSATGIYTLRDVDNLSNPFGVELECVGPRDVRRITECVTGDGSVADRTPNGRYRDRGYGGHEIKVLADATYISKQAAFIAMKARSLGAEANNTCGFHVHASLPNKMDTTSAARLNWARLASVVMAIQNEAFSLFPTRDGNCYSSKIYSLSDMHMHSAWVSRSSNHPTTEIRLHSGTLSPSKIYAWTKVCLGLQRLFHDALQNKETRLVEKALAGNFIELFRTGTVARDYLETRRSQGGRNVRYRIAS